MFGLIAGGAGEALVLFIRTRGGCSWAAVYAELYKCRSQLQRVCLYIVIDQFRDLDYTSMMKIKDTSGAHDENHVCASSCSIKTWEPHKQHPHENQILRRRATEEYVDIRG